MKNFTIALIIALVCSAAYAERPAFTHQCPTETTSKNEECSQGSLFEPAHWTWGADCYTLVVPGLCPPGADNQGDCVEEHGIRDCTPSERSAHGTAAGDSCSVAYQQCGDGGTVKIIFDEDDYENPQPYTGFSGIYVGPPSNQTSKSCINNN